MRVGGEKENGLLVVYFAITGTLMKTFSGHFSSLLAIKYEKLNMCPKYM